MVLALAVFSVTGLLLSSDKDKEKSPPLSAALKPQGEEALKDSDGDGLKDWEEALFFTNPLSPDTDGDGMSDGDEIAAGRDPLKPGPDDLLAKPSAPENPSPYFEPSNLVGRLAEKLGINVVIPRLAGSKEPLDLENIAGQIADESFYDPASLEYFEEKDVLTSPDNSVRAFENYALSLADAASSFGGFNRSPLEIFADALNKEDPSSLTSTLSLSELDPYLAAYDQMLERLKKITVPSRIAATHTRYVNLVMAEKSAVQKIRNADQDVLTAALGAQEYASLFPQYQSFMKDLVNVSSQ